MPSFFARAFSTNFNYFQRLRRPVPGLFARARRKPLFYAQTRAGKLGVRFRAPDPRFTRAKSPRNRRYRMRQYTDMPTAIARKQTHFTRALPRLGRQRKTMHYYKRPARLPRRGVTLFRSGIAVRRLRREVLRARYRYLKRRTRRTILHKYRHLRGHL